jgi:hypothetical protein
LGKIDLEQEQNLLKAIVQQFNNRMADNRMVVSHTQTLPAREGLKTPK